MYIPDLWNHHHSINNEHVHYPPKFPLPLSTLPLSTLSESSLCNYQSSFCPYRLVCTIYIVAQMQLFFSLVSFTWNNYFEIHWCYTCINTLYINIPWCVYTIYLLLCVVFQLLATTVCCGHRSCYEHSCLNFIWTHGFTSLRSTPRSGMARS